MGKTGLSRCMDPIENGDIPASYVSLLEVRFSCMLVCIGCGTLSQDTSSKGIYIYI